MKDKNRNTRALIAVISLIMVVVLLLLIGVIFGREKAHKRVTIPFSDAIEAQDVIRINEVMAANATVNVNKTGKYPDWIELVNTSDEPVSLDGYALMRATDPANIYRFGKVIVEPKGYIVLIADGKSKTDDGFVHLPFKVSSASDSLVLMNASGAVIDSVHTPNLEDDFTYARNAGGAWQVSTTGTPGTANVITEETTALNVEAASATMSVAQDQVEITEIMAANNSYAPDSEGRYYDYIEIHNSASFDVSLEDWTLSDTRDNVVRWKFPKVSIPANGYMLVYCAGADKEQAERKDALYTNFRLSSKGSTVILTRSDGQCIGLIDVPELGKDVAYSRVGGRWTTQYAPTPGMPNTYDSVIAQDKEVQAKNASGVIINEIAASTTTLNYDWIELYNTSGQAVDLSGWGLSDNPARPRKWQFPQGTVIEAGAYLGVFCSGLDKTDENGVPHTNFRLSAAGNFTLTLAKSDGAVLDRIYVPAQFSNITYGRNSEGILRFFTQPTPLMANTDVGYKGKAPTPIYSVSGGLYHSGDVFDVKMSVPETDLRIYYTLDNTDPTESSTLYTGPITVDKTTVLRTRVYGSDYLESYMDTQTYLYDVNNGDGVYVVSVVAEPDDLFSNEKGMMVKGPNAAAEFPYKGANFWQDWEREAHIEIYGGDGSLVLSDPCGIKLHGQYSRAEDQQAFKIYARAKYGASKFNAALFSNRPYTSYNSFLLRSSGQDTDMARMRDSVLTSLASDTSVMYQETEVCVLYLNGKYWGQYYLREHISTHSICQFEGWEGQEDKLDLVKANKNVMHGSNDSFAEMVEYAKNCDPTQDSFYEYIDERIDIQNFIEYMALEIFSGNGDTLNVKRYRNANADGKWRWILFDLDWAFFVDTDSINRWLTPGGMGTNKYTDNSFFINCMKNPRFRDEFLTYFGNRMTTVFTTEHVLSLMQARYEVLEPLLEDQFERWGQTPNEYQACLKKMIDYAKTRPGRLLEFFAGTEYLKLSDAEMEKYFGDARDVINGTE